MKKSNRKTFWIVGGAVLVVAAFALVSSLPEAVRYLRIQRL